MFRALWIWQRWIAAAEPKVRRIAFDKVRIPIYSGRVFRFEAGHRSDMKPATIPK